MLQHMSQTFRDPIHVQNVSKVCMVEIMWVSSNWNLYVTKTLSKPIPMTHNKSDVYFDGTQVHYVYDILSDTFCLTYLPHVGTAKLDNGFPRYQYRPIRIINQNPRVGTES